MRTILIVSPAVGGHAANWRVIIVIDSKKWKILWFELEGVYCLPMLKVKQLSDVNCLQLIFPGCA